MNIFSLSHLIELAAELPNPSKESRAERGDNAVIRLPISDWDAVRDADHPEREFDAHTNGCVARSLRKNHAANPATLWTLR